MSLIGLNFIRMREKKSRTDFLIIQLLWNEKKFSVTCEFVKTDLTNFRVIVNGLYKPCNSQEACIRQRYS